MPAANVLIDIDGIVYTTDFQGFDTAMNAQAPAGIQIKLQPWPLRAHLAALGECVIPTRLGLALDEPAFCRQVLQYSRAPERMHEVFAPLALWWASGGETLPVALGGGWYTIGAMLAQLRPWTCGERFLALARCRLTTADGMSFNLGAYLRALLEAGVVALEPAQPLDDLDSATTQALLASVIGLNAATPDVDAKSFPDTPEADRITLRLCRALGWTPAQVWATPAPEVDRLLALLDRIEHAPASATTGVTGLAQHPDAVIIHIEDD